MELNDLFLIKQYSMLQETKNALLSKNLLALTQYHLLHCSDYARLISIFHPEWDRHEELTKIPYLPVGLFKKSRLLSIPDEEVFKVLTSSGTTSDNVSRIYLDRETARRQTLALSRIMTHVLGQRRLPMIIVDSKDLIKNPRTFSARGAGVLGMMSFGRKHFYALNENMELDKDGIESFLNENGQDPFLIFGFTFMLWKYFLLRFGEAGPDLSKGILFHSGGWKKLQEDAVDNKTFKRKFKQVTDLERIYNFYGMVEQVGSVFLEGEDGFLFAPNFADIIIRDPRTWEEAPIGRPGIIQVLSLLPLSYPGHSLLTEDIGVLHGVDDAPCGRKGKYFSVIGRVPRAELRGCSDTHAYGGAK